MYIVCPLPSENSSKTVIAKYDRLINAIRKAHEHMKIYSEHTAVYDERSMNKICDTTENMRCYLLCHDKLIGKYKNAKDIVMVGEAYLTTHPGTSPHDLNVIVVDTEEPTTENTQVAYIVAELGPGNLPVLDPELKNSSFRDPELAIARCNELQDLYNSPAMPPQMKRTYASFAILHKNDIPIAHYLFYKSGGSRDIADIAVFSDIPMHDFSKTGHIVPIEIFLQLCAENNISNKDTKVVLCYKQKVITNIEIDIDNGMFYLKHDDGAITKIPPICFLPLYMSQHPEDYSVIMEDIITS